jgi:hypothetical protein
MNHFQRLIIVIDRADDLILSADGVECAALRSDERTCRPIRPPRVSGQAPPGAIMVRYFKASVPMPAP